METEKLEALFAQHGCTDWRWFDPKEAIVAHWVRMKCRFGCEQFGRNAGCPPNTLSVAESRQFFDEYEHGVIFHFQLDVARASEWAAWTRDLNLELAGIERDAFMLGYPKAFVLFVDHCALCEECTGHRETCRTPRSARPPVTALAVDVMSTVKRVGYSVQPLGSADQTINCYGFLLLD